MSFAAYELFPTLIPRRCERANDLHLMNSVLLFSHFLSLFLFEISETADPELPKYYFSQFRESSKINPRHGTPIKYTKLIFLILFLIFSFESKIYFVFYHSFCRSRIFFFLFFPDIRKTIATRIYVSFFFLFFFLLSSNFLSSRPQYRNSVNSFLLLFGFPFSKRRSALPCYLGICFTFLFLPHNGEYLYSH